MPQASPDFSASPAFSASPDFSALPDIISSLGFSSVSDFASDGMLSAESDGRPIDYEALADALAPIISALIEREVRQRSML